MANSKFGLRRRRKRKHRERSRVGRRTRALDEASRPRFQLDLLARVWCEAIWPKSKPYIKLGIEALMYAAAEALVKSMTTYPEAARRLSNAYCFPRECRALEQCSERTAFSFSDQLTSVCRNTEFARPSTSRQSSDARRQRYGISRGIRLECIPRISARSEVEACARSLRPRARRKRPSLYPRRPRPPLLHRP